MPSAAEQLASSVNFGAIAKATELKQRILFTLLALIVYRLGTYIPIPGINPGALDDLFSQNTGGIFGMFDMFAGGALSRMSIFALNIMPYISASIIIQLMSTASSHLAQLKKDGDSGRQKIIQYTRYGTVFLAAVQALGIASGLEGMTNSQGPAVDNPGLFFKISTIITLTGSTVFLMWLGEQITARGIGNGISLIIMAGIVAELPAALISTLELGKTGALSGLIIIFFLLLAAIVITFIVFMERGQRRVNIQYPKRQVGMKVMGGQSSHLPLKINTAGVIPAIFASALLLLPVTISNFGFADSDMFLKISSMFTQGQPLYMLLYASGIIFFAFFYTSIVFNPKETAENLRKYGGYIPGIRPGERTAEYIESILIRLTTVGSLYLTFVCLMPEFLIAKYPIPFYLGGTSILIVVVVAMDTVTQVQTRLMSSQYESLIRKTKFGK